VSNNHVNQIRDQFTRQAQAYADTAQAKDAAAHVRFDSGDAKELPFADGEFDVVMCRAAKHYGLTDWLAHGGPAPEAEQEIRRRFAEALVNDQTGLDVRRDGDETYFTHQTLVLVGRR
jgi:hypothetical protein